MISQRFPVIVKTADGLLAAWQTQDGTYKQAGDGSGWSIVARSFTLPSEHIVLVGGESQVNTSSRRPAGSSVAT